MLLSKEHLSVGSLASKDDTRPILQQVKAVRNADGDVTTVATDGYVLAEVIQRMPDPTEFPQVGDDSNNMPIDDAFIDAEVALKTKRAIKKNSLLPILNYAIVEDGAITTTDLQTKVRYGFHKVEGNFPDYEPLVPRTPAEFQVRINPKYLIKGLQLFDKDDGMTIEFGATALSPVVLRSDSGGVKRTVVVMPLKR